MHIRLGKDIHNPYRRDHQQFDRIDDPAVIVGTAGTIGYDFITVGGFIQNDPVDRLMGRIQYSYRHQIFLAGLNRMSDIQFKGGLAIFMAADLFAVDPDFGFVIHRPKPQDIPTLLARITRHIKFLPVPRHPVIFREGYLNDPGYFDLFSLGLGLVIPLLVPAAVVRVGRQKPIRTIQRKHLTAMYRIRLHLCKIGKSQTKYGNHQ
ncbi:MAG: hypothetical protein BWY71_01137 [Planctomycetes bacterium ADurb.Bin412]|nr:MAG: hypothetical protein BWY71_01137 [Planctomycetes bacterium ADurb.Bin412]